MKNLLKVFAVAVAIVLAACSKDAVEAPAVTADEAQVTFTTTIPGATEGRAIADGSTVDKLYYAVYEHGQTTKLIDGTETISGKTATVNVTLVSGMKYDIVFWAQKEGAPYTFNTMDNCIEIDWTNLVGNNEARDAFIFVRKALEVNGSIQETITLKRPFAQLNIGISDFEAAKKAGFELAETKVSVDSYDQINFFGGEAYSKADGTGDYGMPAGTETPVTFACAAPLADPATITIKGTTYKYVSMNYILPAMPTDAYDVDITFCTANEAKQYSVPTFAGVTFERNHRTNIMGSLLTDPGKFVIEIDEEFDEPAYNYLPWDGASLTKPAYDATTNTYTVSTAAELAWVGALVNGVLPSDARSTYAAQESLKNATVELAADIDLAGNNWIPMGGLECAWSDTKGYFHMFEGTFDGKGYTISNATVKPVNLGPWQQNSAGLFGGLGGQAVVKNVTIEDFTVAHTHYAGVVAGWIGTTDKNPTIEGVTVRNCSVTVEPEFVNDEWDNGDKAGGIVGYFVVGTIKDCVVENTTITGYRDLGGIAGYAGDDTTTTNVTNNTIGADVKLFINNEHNYKNYATQAEHQVGSFVGRNEGATVSGTGEATIGAYIVNVASLEEAVSTPNTTVSVVAGTYEMPAVVAEGVTLECEEGTVLQCTEVIEATNLTVKNATFKQVESDKAQQQAAIRLNGSGTFENCIIEGVNGLYQGYSTEGSMNGDLKFINCTIKASWAYGINTGGTGDIYIEGCEIYGWNSFGNDNAGDEIIIKDTKFYNNGNYGMLRFYQKASVTNCVFGADMNIDFKNGYYNTTSVNNQPIEFTNCSVESAGRSAVASRVIELIDLSEFENASPNLIIDGTKITAQSALIKSADELKAFAAAVNEGSFAGPSAVLLADIDLNNENWTPIGNSSKQFTKVFDGMGFTVSNLNIEGNNSDAGFFGFTSNGEIKNLNIHNAKVSGYLDVAVVAGTPYTSKYNNIKVSGLVEVNGFAYVGAVGGKNAYASWKDITVDVEKGSYVKANSVSGETAYRTYVGGVIGFMGEGGHSFTNVKSNIDVSGSTCDVGGITGIAHYGNSFINCSSSGNIELTNAPSATRAEEIGGIAGVWNNGGANVTFDGCSFSGTLKVNLPEVDLSDNKIHGAAYSASGPGQVIVK